MKAFLIDPVAKRIVEVLTDGSLDSIYELTHCDMVQPVYINRERDFVLVDENACYKPEGSLMPFFILGQPMLGRGLVLGQYGEEWGDPRLSLDILRSIVAFPP